MNAQTANIASFAPTVNANTLAHLRKYQKPPQISVLCDLCPAEARDDYESLKRRGWYVGSRECFCPTCAREI